MSTDRTKLEHFDDLEWSLPWCWKRQLVVLCGDAEVETEQVFEEDGTLTIIIKES
jgi:hypothetical protein